MSSINQLITTGHARILPGFPMGPPRKGSAHPSEMDPPTQNLSRGGVAGGGVNPPVQLGRRPFCTDQ